MSGSGPDDGVTRRILRWADGQATVRAVLLTGSRAQVGAQARVNALSDYDLILCVTEPADLLGDRTWTGELGPVLVELPARGQERSWRHRTRLVLYEDGTRIDFTVWAVDLLRSAGTSGVLPAELDAGYRVLLDKDGLTAGLPAASGTAYVLRPPDQVAFTALVEEFWWETLYVARNLRRGELLPARFSFECVLKLDLLRRMLEWSVGVRSGWTYRPGVMGRGLQAQLPPALWRELEATYTGPDVGESWDALARTMALFRAVAGGVARQLSLTYPDHLDAQIARQLERIRAGT